MSQEDVSDSQGDGRQASSIPSIESYKNRPIAVLIVGMAGSGKTTLMQRLQLHISKQGMVPYMVNLDPAVATVPYQPNIDIRDTVKYKEVMKQYGLGPNGGILTACNLFATKFDQVMALLEKPREPSVDYIVLDTPGQIEMFTWSASGGIVSQVLGSSFRTVVAFVIDSPRCNSPQTFASNMLQACSILYKTRLPVVLVLNKCDVCDTSFIKNWMDDIGSYQEAISADSSYAAQLCHSLSLVLDQFYSNIPTVEVSALAGVNMDKLLEGFQKAAQEWETTYYLDLKARADQAIENEKQRQEKDLDKLEQDLTTLDISKQGDKKQSSDD